MDKWCFYILFDTFPINDAFFVRKFILITQTYDAYSENPLKRILGKCARIFKTDFQRSSMRKRFDLFFDNTYSCRNIYFDSPSARS